MYSDKVFMGAESMQNIRPNASRRIQSIATDTQAPRYAAHMRNRPWFLVARERAKELGMSYQDIADRIGVQKATVGHWMTGRNRPRLEQIARIAAVLQTTVPALVADDAYYITDDTERAILDAVRQVPAEYRSQVVRLIGAFSAALEHPSSDSDA